jgi:hypothetical protein
MQSIIPGPSPDCPNIRTVRRLEVIYKYIIFLTSSLLAIFARRLEANNLPKIGRRLEDKFNPNIYL